MSKYAAVLALPFGCLGLTIRNEILHGLDFLPPDTPPLRPDCAMGDQVEKQLREWCAGKRRQFDLIYQADGTAFQQCVWQAMLDIPMGQTRSYGEIARLLGSSPRAVGGACGRNPVPLIIPCHRIIARQGLGGFNQGKVDYLLEIKRWLLNHEQHQTESYLSALATATVVAHGQHFL